MTSPRKIIVTSHTAYKDYYVSGDFDKLNFFFGSSRRIQTFETLSCKIAHSELWRCRIEGAMRVLAKIE